MNARLPLALALLGAACSPDGTTLPPGNNPPVTLLPLVPADVTNILREHLRVHSNALLTARAAMAPSNLIERSGVPTEMTPDERAQFDADREDLVTRLAGPAALVRTEPTRLTYRLTPQAMCPTLAAGCVDTYNALELEAVVTQPTAGTLSIVVRTASTTEQLVTAKISRDRGEATVDLGQALGAISRSYTTLGGDPTDIPTRMSGRVDLTWSQASERSFSARARASTALVIEDAGSYGFATGPGLDLDVRLDASTRRLDVAVSLSDPEWSHPFQDVSGFVARVGCPIDMPCPSLVGTIRGSADALILEGQFDAGTDESTLEKIGFGAMGARLSLDQTTLFSATARPAMLAGVVKTTGAGIEVSSTQDLAVDLVMNLASLRAQMIDVAPWTDMETLRLTATGMPSLRFQEMLGMGTVTRVIRGSVGATFQNGAQTFSASAGQCVSAMAMMAATHPLDELVAGPCQ